MTIGAALELAAAVLLGVRDVQDLATRFGVIDTPAVSRSHRAALAAVSGAIEVLVALAWWWRPEHALVWAVLAGCVLVIAAIVEHGTR